MYLTNIKTAKKSFVKQLDQSDCGIACLASVLNYHGGYSSLDELASLSGKDPQGTSLLGLFHAANNLGFEADGYKAENIQQLYSIKNPCILHLEVKNNLQHFVVFYGIKGDKVLLGDPAAGISELKVADLENQWKTKCLLTLTPTSSFNHVKENRQADKIQWLRQILKQDFNIMLVALFLGFIISSFAIASAVFSQKLIDYILPSKSATQLITAISLFAAVLGIKVLLTFFRGQFLLTQSRDLNNRMIGNFFNALLGLPKGFFDSRKTGDLISRMNDIRRIQIVISNIVGNIIIQLLTAVTVLIAIFLYSNEIGILIMAILPVYIFILYRLNSKVFQSQKSVMSAHSHNESNYIDTITGIQEIKTFGTEQLFKKVTLGHYSYYQKCIFKFGKVKLKFNAVIEGLGAITTLLVMAYSSFLVMLENIQIGELVAIFSLSGTIIPSIGMLILSNIQIQEAHVAFERMAEFTNLDSTEEAGPLTNLSFSEVNQITVKNLSFHYPGTIRLLENISFSVRRGKLSAILGESGSGKSTLLQLLLKFYSYEHGSIRLDSKPIETLNTGYYRNLIGFVPQDIKIFNNTCLFNIALSDKKEDLTKAKAWCDAKGFTNFINKIPNGYSAYLGEDGVKISGGQKQLLALARALYREPKFLFIDEGTSSLDRETEKFYLNTLVSLKGKMGILFISHRLKPASIADEIYILDTGTITECGTPDELLLKGGNLYSEAVEDIINSVPNSILEGFTSQSKV